MDGHELIRVLEAFAKVDPEIQLQTILAFLYVARREKCTQKDVELELGMTNAAASRNISYWTDRRFDRKPGVGFIDRKEDDQDRRFKQLQLTARGQSFYEKITGERHGKTSRKQVDR
jgi:DNA-binding MarR family transcriptional regulator